MKRQKTDGLDRQISYRLTKALDDDGRADWLDVRERAGMSRTLWRWSQRRVLLVAGVLVLAVGAAGASTGIIPWLGEAPKPIPPTIYPICGANDVQAKLHLHKSSQSRELSGSIELINTGDKLCALEGQPKVSLIGSGADSARLQVEMFSPVAKLKDADKTMFGFGGSDQTLLGRSLEPPDRSSVSFGWENWCGSDSGELTLRIQIPNGSEFAFSVTKLPECINPARASRLVFGTANGAPPPVGPSFPLRPKILPAKDGEPLVVEQGKVFHYRVALTNTSTSPYRFGEGCPAYGEQAHMGRWASGAASVPAFALGQYVLNCHSVGVVEPGKTVTFEMELPASKEPLDSKAEGEIYWGLDWRLMAKAPITMVGIPPKHSPSDVYGVFARSIPNATFSAYIENVVRETTSGEGSIVPGSSRVLLQMDKASESVYAWETVTGKFCFYFDRVSGCAEAAQYMKPVFLALDGFSSVGPSVIGGFAQDRVKRVDMAVDGKLSPVKLERNTFFAEFPHGVRVTAIVATLNDGSKMEIKHDQLDAAGMVPVG